MSPSTSFTDRLLKRFLSKMWHRMILLQAAHPSILENPAAYWAAGLFGRSATLRLTDGTRLQVRRDNLREVTNILLLSYYGARFGGSRSVRHRWRLSTEEGVVETPSGIRFSLDSLEANIFAETFIYDLHRVETGLAGRVVVDVGGHVGDTALYFAGEGATVHSMEPDPLNFQRLQANIALNPKLSGQIHPLKVAVGVDGMVSFHSGLLGGSGKFATIGEPIQVESISLTSFLDRNHIEHPYLLKLDCKGSEFEIVKDPAMARFEQ